MLKLSILTKIVLSLLTTVIVIVTGAQAIPSSATPALLHSSPTDLSKAQALNREGARQLAAGNAEAALDIWKQAEAAYIQAGDTTGRLGSQLLPRCRLYPAPQCAQWHPQPCLWHLQQPGDPGTF